MNRREYLSAFSTAGILAASGCVQGPQFGEDTLDSSYCIGDKPCPSISLQPSNPVIGQQVVFDASGSQSPDGSTLAYFWTDPEHDYFFNEGPTYQRRFDEKGNHSVVVWVTPADNVNRSNNEIGEEPGRPELISRATRTVTVHELTNDGIDLDQTDVNIHLQGDEQSVPVDESARLSLSASNLIGNETLTLQLLIEVPSGLTVNGTSFQEGGGQYTSTFELEAGETISESLTVEATAAGPYRISGYIVYYFDADDRRQTQSSDIKLRFY